MGNEGARSNNVLEGGHSLPSLPRFRVCSSFAFEDSLQRASQDSQHGGGFESWDAREGDNSGSPEKRTANRMALEEVEKSEKSEDPFSFSTWTPSFLFFDFLFFFCYRVPNRAFGGAVIQVGIRVTKSGEGERERKLRQLAVASSAAGAASAAAAFSPFPLPLPTAAAAGFSAGAFASSPPVVVAAAAAGASSVVSGGVSTVFDVVVVAASVSAASFGRLLASAAASFLAGGAAAAAGAAGAGAAGGGW